MQIAKIAELDARCVGRQAHCLEDILLCLLIGAAEPGALLAGVWQLRIDDRRVGFGYLRPAVLALESAIDDQLTTAGRLRRGRRLRRRGRSRLIAFASR